MVNMQKDDRVCQRSDSSIGNASDNDDNDCAVNA